MAVRGAYSVSRPNNAKTTIATPASMIGICQPGQAIAVSQSARPTTIKR